MSEIFKKETSSSSRKMVSLLSNEALNMGSDNVCRVADFTTFRGIERRAVNKVCLLPLENDIFTEEENKDLES
ncbi:unnamed protein product [Pieris macdunnoughi]|uniref:Uncharacterized protein n=1 Tax=Pieris macdunnoughi TaxID=345717 RepID=A0A821XT63_9NEOP|nr:unnamed protein product [Pieris macdunnoughi]